MATFQQILTHGRVHSPYGATEALPVTTISDREVLEFSATRTQKGHGTCVGRPVREVDVRIIRETSDPIARWSDAHELPVGQIGEIVVRGPPVTKTYDRLPDATAMAKIPVAQPAAHIAEPGRSDIFTEADRPTSDNSKSGISARLAHRPWHRMGDTGYFDSEGRLWFCGRKAERVVSGSSVLYTERCEPVFNRHPKVTRTALIQIGLPGHEEAALVVEPHRASWPRTRLARLHFAQELRELGLACETTRGICLFFFHRKFPVDVRHNAKIHRLALARHFSTRRPIRTA